MVLHLPIRGTHTATLFVSGCNAIWPRSTLNLPPPSFCSPLPPMTNSHDGATWLLLRILNPPSSQTPRGASLASVTQGQGERPQTSRMSQFDGCSVFSSGDRPRTSRSALKNAASGPNSEFTHVKVPTHSLALGPQPGFALEAHPLPVPDPTHKYTHWGAHPPPPIAHARRPPSWSAGQGHRGSRAQGQPQPDSQP